MHAKVHAAYMLRISREMKQHQANIMITITKIDELPERLANSKSSDSVGIGVGVEAAITLLLECILLSNSRNVLVAPPTREDVNWKQVHIGDNFRPNLVSAVMFRVRRKLHYKLCTA